jgi:transketolase
MGGSHHALEDYGALLTLQNMRAFIPAFSEDVAPLISKMSGTPHPVYLRLGKDEKPKGFDLPPYAPWRKLLAGRKATLLAVGPLAGPLLSALQGLKEAERPEFWVLSELPLSMAEPPDEFLEGVASHGQLCVVEEHVLQGSVGQMLAHWLACKSRSPRRFDHCYAKGYPSGTYGSQNFHRKENGLDPESVLKTIEKRP